MEAAITRVVLASVGVALFGVAILRRRHVLRALRRFFFAPDHAVNLAVFRVVVFGFVLVSSSTGAAIPLADLPPEFHAPPAGLGWLIARLPIDGAMVGGAHAALHGTAFLALIGLFTRTSAALSAILAIYVLGVPQMFGKVIHEHHQIWFMLLLATSPSGDALSLDAVRRRQAAGRSPRYGFPIRVAWVLIGLIYLFPGIRKLWSAGPGWVLSDNLENIMHQRWFELNGWTPSVRIDEWGILPLIAAGTVLFELSFLVVIFTRFRAIAVAAGLLFHLGTRMMMRIPFHSLVVAYAVFVDWHGLARRLRSRARERPPPASVDRGRPAAPAMALAGVLAAGIIGFGVAGIESGWPISAYPSFKGIHASEREVLRVEAHTQSGRVLEDVQRILAREMASARFTALVKRILSEQPEQRAQRLEELWSRYWVDEEADPVRMVRYFLDIIDIDPDAANGGVKSSTMLHEAYLDA